MCVNNQSEETEWVILAIMMHTKHNAIASYYDNLRCSWYFDRNSTCCALSSTPSPHRTRPYSVQTRIEHSTMKMEKWNLHYCNRYNLNFVISQENKNRFFFYFFPRRSPSKIKVLSESEILVNTTFSQY